MEDISFNQDTMHGPSYIEQFAEMRTPPLIITFSAVPRVSAIERFHCNF